jgi:hypothetical protein
MVHAQLAYKFPKSQVERNKEMINPVSSVFRLLKGTEIFS